MIGQSEYVHIPKLANPGNDAKRVDELLTGFGLKTEKVDNRSNKRLKRDLADFIEDAEGADVAVIYYSGHGIEAGGENYLVPVDAKVTQEAVDEGELVKLAPVLQALRERVHVTIVLLDACRTNPFPAGMTLRMAGDGRALLMSTGGLAASKGAVALDEAGRPESLGEIIGFAAAPGQVALDGTPGTSSPYAAAIAKHLAAEGLDFGQVMTLVSEEVYLITKGRQQPWTNASLRRLLYFGVKSEDGLNDEALIRGERRELLLTIAATPRDLRRTVETYASTDNVPLDGLYAMLRSLGVEVQRNPGQLSNQLQIGAEKLKAFMEEREALRSSDAEISRLSALADEAVDEGALNAAIAFHEKAKARVASLARAVEDTEAEIKARRLEFAAVYAKSAETRELAFDYLTAAQDWGEAYAQAERWDPVKAFTYRMAQASALKSYGEYKGDNSALLRAIDLHNAIIATVARASRPDDWAKAQSNLGNALQLLGARESSSARLEEAVVAYRAALTERTRDRVPLDWARTQNNLGAALWVLGSRESGIDHLEEAAIAYRAALEERTRERAPLGWAATQNNLGGVLWAIGERETGSARFEEAIAAYRAALEERTRDRVPLDWAATQNNLGIALQASGEREGGVNRLKEAIVAFRAALEERTRGRVPLDWAATQNNLGLALQTLDEREHDFARLEEAIAAFRAALEERTRVRAPLDWAMTKGNLGIALQALGERRRDLQLLREAEECLTAAWHEYRAAGQDYGTYFSERIAALRRTIAEMR